VAGPIWFDHALFSPFVRRGQIHLDEFADEHTAIPGTYPLLGAEACNGLAVPELMTGQVEIKPVVVRQRTGASGNFMY
jgi:hypothetical protein